MLQGVVILKPLAVGAVDITEVAALIGGAAEAAVVAAEAADQDLCTPPL